MTTIFVRRNISDLDELQAVCASLGYELVVADALSAEPVVAPCYWCGEPCEHADDIYCSARCATDAETDL